MFQYLFELFFDRLYLYLLNLLVANRKQEDLLQPNPMVDNEIESLANPTLSKFLLRFSIKFIEFFLFVPSTWIKRECIKKRR